MQSSILEREGFLDHQCRADIPGPAYRIVIQTGYRGLRASTLLRRRDLRTVLFSVILVLSFACHLCAQSRPLGGDVLLTFDTEFEGDAEAIVALGLDVPATYFWTGAYAASHPDLLRWLANQGHTIGSHGYHHDNLTSISARQVQLDVELAKLVLEEITGRRVKAFRAPYLEYSDSVMAEVERLGFLIDSSDKAPWMQNRRLPEIAISEFEKLLISDFDIFVGRSLDEATGLDFLIRAYSYHAVRGQPFVMLLHPRVIGRHSRVIHAFIDYVKENKGQFWTVEGYLDHLQSPHGPRHIAIWAELGSMGGIDSLIQEAERRGATDLIWSLPYPARSPARGPTLAAASISAIQEHGIRVHLALPVTQNPGLAAVLPHAVMADTIGRPSTEWVSPSHPEVVQRLVEMTVELISQLGVDGIHFYGVGYPGLSWDFSPAARHRFSAMTSVKEGLPEEILAHHYVTWTHWRSSEMALLLDQLADAARAERADIKVSISLLSEAATDYRVRERVGQDYRLLGGIFDMIIPSTSLTSGQRAPAAARMLLAIRTQVGPVPLLLNANVHENRQLLDEAADSAFGPILSARALSSGMIVDFRGATSSKRHAILPPLAMLLSRHSTVESLP